MCKFKLKELNFSRMRHWILEANLKKDDDPVYSFIASWIGFNHFYSTYVIYDRDAFSNWTKTNMNNSFGDKAQLMYLVTTNEFQKYFVNFKNRREDLFELEIRLPVINLLKNELVPKVELGTYKFKDIDHIELFLIIYQIRNNLFHGNKDPFFSNRDKVLSQICSQFMLVFLSDLVSNTFGEELDIYDDEQKKEIKAVSELAMMEI